MNFQERRIKWGGIAAGAMFGLTFAIAVSQVGKGKVTGVRPGQTAIGQRQILQLDLVRPEAIIPGVPASIKRSQADAIVSTREQLLAALAGGKKTIWVEESAQIDMAAVSDHREGRPDGLFRLPDGVILASGRSETIEGALLYYSRHMPQRFMIEMGNRTRISGIRIRGPQLGTQKKAVSDRGIGIVGVADVIVDRCEISGWPIAGIEVLGVQNTKTTMNRVRITCCYIHHNQMDGLGYGVVVGGEGGYAQIDRNTFNFNRHHIAGDGTPGTGYVCELNFALSGGSKYGDHYEHHFDMHGSAGSSVNGGVGGELVDVRDNTIRGEQDYGLLGRLTRPAFVLRGKPGDSAHFRRNVIAHDDRDEATRMIGGSYPNFFVTGNQYDVDTSLELAAGDFDGDGCQDIFQATGGVWAFSPRGQFAWRYLNHQPFRLRDLRFGDFDGNGKTDVFLLHPNGWKWSKDGVAAFTNLPAHYPLPPSGYRFGDFDGDRKTDLFVTVGGQWKFSSACASAFQDLNTSSLKIEELRFGDFDGNGKTDVFSFSSNQWSVSFDGRSGWTKLNSKISGNLGELVFADFNGDKYCDIGRSNGATWHVSWGGKSGWQTLNGGALGLYPLAGMVVADFDGDRKADALHVDRRIVGPSPVMYGAHFMMASGGSGSLAVRSVTEIR